MRKPKRKFYVVWKGVQPGIYHTWDEARRQVEGFHGAKHKSFDTLDAARVAFGQHYSKYVQPAPRAVAAPRDEPAGTPKRLDNIGVDLNGMAVDAACSGVPGPMEYRGVWLGTGEEAFRQGPFPDGTNNVGEFLAIVHALAMLKRQGRTGVPVYSDSSNAIGWVKKKVCRTRLQPTPANTRIFELLTRALVWLKENPIENPILKWETTTWGENPADFGRK
jgi:ribonuclease HI